MRTAFRTRCEQTRPQVRHLRQRLMLTILALGWSPAVAFGQSGANFEFEAPGVCPSRDAFVEAVRERVPTEQRANVPRRLSELIDGVSIDASGKRGQVAFAGDSTSAPRSVNAESCEEVVTSLALICAIALNSSAEQAAGAPALTELESETSGAAAGAAAAGTEASAQGQPPPPLPPPPSPSEQLAEGGSDDLSQKQSAPEEDEPSVESDDDAEETDTDRSDDTDREAELIRPASGPSVHDSYEWSVGAGGRVDTWTGPELALGFDALVSVASTLDWSLRAGVVHTRSRASVDERDADFRLYAARLEGCPTRWVNEDWVIEPCVTVSVGLLLARGLEESALARAQQSETPWVDAAVVVRAQTPLLGPVRFEAQLELGTAVTDHRFEFEDPEVTLFHPRFGPGPAARLGAIFPL